MADRINNRAHAKVRHYFYCLYVKNIYNHLGYWPFFAKFALAGVLLHIKTYAHPNGIA
ncbi:hypothetical protein HMPREF6745_0723 [Prevotella sp. oral taxon 472 str. F0295]|nr:hypothetical protein HMPREF6745_0723 [Prevotella sp. oral taxon 472 str. F0295]